MFVITFPQIFDGLVTIISFALDIAFMKGVTFLSDEQIVFVLTLLFPWRVIRILNSKIILVVIVVIVTVVSVFIVVLVVVIIIANAVSIVIIVVELALCVVLIQISS